LGHCTGSEGWSKTSSFTEPRGMKVGDLFFALSRIIRALLTGRPNACT
jgi:hypothetical protein